MNPSSSHAFVGDDGQFPEGKGGGGQHPRGGNCAKLCAVSLDGVPLRPDGGEDACWREASCGTVSFQDAEGRKRSVLGRKPARRQRNSQVAHVRKIRPDLPLFDRRRFRPYWFQSGTPTFLADLLSRRRVAALALEGMFADDDLLSTIDVDRMSAEALLFQTGYLTIAGEERDEDAPLYRLDYPNQEVKRSLNALLLTTMAPDVAVEAENRELRRLMRTNDFAGVERLFRAFLASIPNEWYANTGMSGAHYASVFYSHFAAAGMDVRAEESTVRARSDLAVLYDGSVYLFEFKVADGKPGGRALAQIRERGYADKYRRPGVPIHLIGVGFGREERNIVGFAFETA